MWFVYAFIGWVMETLYVSIPAGHFVERGFLRGPIIPIYAFGAYIVLYLLMPFGTHPLYIFIFGVIATSALEYITSYILEKLFNMKWWDYSKQKFNIHGRICLKNSTLFGLLSLALVLWIHPLIQKWTLLIPDNIRTIFTITFLVIALIDFGFTLASILNLRTRFKDLQRDIEDFQQRALRKGEARLLRIFPNLKSSLSSARIEEFLDSIRSKFDSKK